MSDNGFDPAKVAEDAMKEFANRLANPERRAKISDTVLTKFSGDAIRLAEAQARDRERQVHAPREILDIIYTTDLSVDRKDRIVDAEIAKLEERILKLRVAREERYEQR